VFWGICIWDRLPLSRLSAIVVAPDVGIIYQKARVEQVSPDGFRAPIARLPSADQYMTIWSPLVGLYSGAPELAFIMI